MKKTRFFTLTLLSIAVIFASSCSKDDEDTPLAPSLTVTETHTGATGGDIEITLGDQLEFAWESRKGDNNIKTFTLSMSGIYSTTDLTTYNGNELPYTVKSGDKSIYVDTISFPSAGLNLGATNYTFTSSDGEFSKSVSFKVTVVAPTVGTTDLTEAQSFEWKRGPAGTFGLSQFGLKWTSNTSQNAIIAVDGSTTMYKLTGELWTSMATQEELASIIAYSNPITKYEGVNVEDATRTYDDVLAVHHDGTNYLIHITNSLVEVAGIDVTVTIGGKYKK